MPYSSNDISEDEQYVYVFELEEELKLPSLRRGYVWKKIDDRLLDKLRPRYNRHIIDAIKNIPVECSGILESDTVPWFSLGGKVRQLKEQISFQLLSNGYKTIQSMEHHCTNGSSILFRIETERNRMYCKFAGEGSPEAAITETLSRRIPDRVGPIAHVILSRNCFFSIDFGATYSQLGDEWELPSDPESTDRLFQYLEPAIETIVAFHIDAVTVVDEVLKCGILDATPEKIKSDLKPFIQELQEKKILTDQDAEELKTFIPEIENRLDALSSGCVPLSVCHGDLHTENMTQPRNGESVKLFDWYDSTVSHPFFDVAGSHLFSSTKCTCMLLTMWEDAGFGSKREFVELLKIANTLEALWRVYYRIRRWSKRRDRLHWSTELDACSSNMQTLLRVLRKVTESKNQSRKRRKKV